MVCVYISVWHPFGVRRNFGLTIFQKSQLRALVLLQNADHISQFSAHQYLFTYISHCIYCEFMKGVFAKRQ